MSFADQMLNLRREIEDMRASRMAMMHRMKRFRTDLRNRMARSMGQMHKAFSEQCRHARTARHLFMTRNRDTVGEMIQAFSTDRMAGHRNFMSKHAMSKHA